MLKRLRVILSVIGVCWPLGLVVGAFAQAPPNASPPVGMPYANCLDGRALRIVSGYPSCAPTPVPTLTGCGAGTIDATATDFIGQVTVPAGVSSCTLNFSRLYSAAPLICIMQPQTAGLSLSVGSGVTGNNGTVSTLTVPFTLTISQQKFGYICGPG